MFGKNEHSHPKKGKAENYKKKKKRKGIGILWSTKKKSDVCFEWGNGWGWDGASGGDETEGPRLGQDQ